MKKLLTIFIMLFLAFSQNATAKDLSKIIADEYIKFMTPHANNFVKGLIPKNARGSYTKPSNKTPEEMQADYEAGLTQMKRDNPNFKKPPKKTVDTKNQELSRDDLIEYRQRQIAGH